MKLDPPFTHCSEQNLETSISPLVPELSSDNIQCSLSCLSVASVDLLASPVKKQNKTNQRLVIKPSSLMDHCHFPLE